MGFFYNNPFIRSIFSCIFFCFLVDIDSVVIVVPVVVVVDPVVVPILTGDTG